MKKNRLLISVGLGILLLVGLLGYALNAGITGSYSIDVKEAHCSADKIKYYKTNQKLVFEAKNFAGQKTLALPKQVQAGRLTVHLTKGAAALTIGKRRYSLEDGNHAVAIPGKVAKCVIQGNFSGSVQLK